MKKVIIIIIAVLLIIKTVTIIGLNKIGDEIIDGLIDSELASIGQTEQSVEVKQNNAEKTIDSNEGQNPSQTDSPTASSSEVASQNASSTDVDNLDENKSAGTKVKDKTETKIITVEKANEIKEQVTTKDKVTAAALVVKRLSSEDISELKELMNGGLTAEKKKEAVKIAYERFTAEEIVQIKELYHKYMK